MKIYVPNHLRNRIKVVDDLCRLIQQYNLENSIKEEDSYYYYYKQLNYDPVKKFIGICISQQKSEEITTNIVNYLTGLFYSVKGSIKVFDFIVTHLGLNPTTKPEYNPSLGSLSITLKEVPSTIDEEFFRKTFEDFLKSLLYVNIININIDSYEININDVQQLKVDTKINVYGKWDLTRNDIL